nr:unnamed protein product [Trichobilharzia regenti]
MFDVLFCTASILNLVAICLDRYLAVTKPIVYAKHNNMRRVQISIALVWIVSFLIAIPLVCGLNINTYNDPTICQSFNALYIICSSLGSFYLPAIILIVVYQRIFALIKQRHKSLRLTQTSIHHPQQATPTPSHHQQNKSQFRQHQQQPRQQSSLKQPQELEQFDKQFNDSSTIQLSDITSSNKEQNNLKIKDKIHSKNNSDQEIILLENKYPTLTTPTTTATTMITPTGIDKKDPLHLITNDYNCIISSFTQSDHEFIEEEKYHEEEEGINENLFDDIHFEGPRLDIPSPNLNYNLDRYILPCNQTTSIDYLKVTNQNSVPITLAATTTLSSVDNRYNDSLILPERIDLKILKSFDSPKYIRCSSSRSSASASSLCSPFAIEDYNEITFTCCHLEHYDSVSTQNTPSRSSVGKECIVEHGEVKDHPEEEQSLPNLTVHMPTDNSQLSVQTLNTPCSMIQCSANYNNNINNNNNLSNLHRSSCQHQIPFKSSNIINLFTLPRIKTCLNCTDTRSSSISSSDVEYSWPQISECIRQSSGDDVQVANDSAENYLCTTTIIDSDTEEDDYVDDEEEDYDEDIDEGLLFTDENTTICELCQNEISSKSFCIYMSNELCNCIDYRNESIVFQYRCQPNENFCQQYTNHTPNGDVYKTDINHHNNICPTRSVKVKQIKSNLSQKKKFNFHIEFCKYLSLFNDKFKQGNQIIARNLNRARKSNCFKSQHLNKQYNNNINNNSSQKILNTSNKSSRANFSSIKMDNQKTDFLTIDPSPTSPVDLDSCSGKSTRKQCHNNSPKYTSTRNKNVLSHKEKKATKTLAIVLGVFLACWLPFFSINVSLGLCIYLGPDQYGFCEMAGSLMSSCTWLGYVNSALNPVIYTIFNLEFRNAFKKLLHIN